MTRIWKPVINFEKGRGGQIPQLIIYHITGYPASTAQQVFNHFCNFNSDASAHALGLPNGDIWEFVKDEDVSWGAGTVGYVNGKAVPPKNRIAREHWQRGGRINQIAFNYEILCVDDKDPTPEQYASAAEWGREKARKFNIPINAEHFDGHRNIKITKVCPGRVSVGKIIELANRPIQPSPAREEPMPKAELPKIQDPPWLRLFRQRVLGFIGYGDLVFGGVPRSSKWSSFRNEFLRKNPLCEACGVKAETVHHIEPYHLNPELELSENNLISLCDECHLVLAHLKSFKRHDPEIRETARQFKTKIENYL